MVLFISVDKKQADQIVRGLIDYASRVDLQGIDLYHYVKSTHTSEVSNYIYEFLYFPNVASYFGLSDEVIEKLGFYRSVSDDMFSQDFSLHSLELAAQSENGDLLVPQIVAVPFFSNGFAIGFEQIPEHHLYSKNLSKNIF